MRRKLWLIIAIMFGFTFTGCFTTVEPGNVGILIKKDGSQKGVQDYPVQTGRVWTTWNEDVIEYPAFMQTVKWTANSNEGKSLNEEISFNTSEGVIVKADIAVSYQLKPNNIPSFYLKFRCLNIENFTSGYMHDLARTAFIKYGSSYTVDELYSSKREALRDSVASYMQRTLNKFLDISQVSYLGELRYPGNIIDAINSKIAATQNAIRAENELRQAEAEAKKSVAEAQGQAEANKIKSNSITPAILRMRELEVTEKAIYKWTGGMPTYWSSNGKELPLLGKLPF